MASLSSVPEAQRAWLSAQGRRILAQAELTGAAHHASARRRRPERRDRRTFKDPPPELAPEATPRNPNRDRAARGAALIPVPPAPRALGGRSPAAAAAAAGEHTSEHDPAAAAASSLRSVFPGASQPAEVGSSADVLSQQRERLERAWSALPAGTKQVVTELIEKLRNGAGYLNLLGGGRERPDFETIGDAGVAKLAAVLPQCASLEGLWMRYIQMGDAGARALAAALPMCASLDELVLSCNQIGDVGAQALAAALPQCASLQELDLSGNQIGEASTRALAAALPQCASLQKLNLSGNHIGEAGARALAAALPQCASLQELKLSSNQIEDAGAQAVAAVLPQCASLKYLSLCLNNITDACVASSIIPALPLSSLTNLFLRDWNDETQKGSFTGAGRERLYKLSKNNRLGGNEVKNRNGEGISIFTSR
jgi:hypothetical protein